MKDQKVNKETVKEKLKELKEKIEKTPAVKDLQEFFIRFGYNDRETFTQKVIIPDIKYHDFLDSKITEEQLKMIFKEKKEDMKQMKASHIFFKSSKNKEENSAILKKAEQVRENIIQGADFKEMVEKHSQAATRKDEGSMGFITAGTVKESDLFFAEAVFKLKKGEISPVIITPGGFHIVKAEEIRETYEQLKSVLRKALFLNIQNAHLQRLVEQSEITIVNKEYNALLRKKDNGGNI